mgnify:CR=1 FL=1
MRMSKPITEIKAVAVNAGALKETTARRLLAAMEVFMRADFAEETAVALVQRAA